MPENITAVVVVAEMLEEEKEKRNNKNYKKKAISFEETKPKVRYIWTWTYAHREARTSVWILAAADHQSFARRIAQVDEILTPVLEHLVSVDYIVKNVFHQNNQTSLFSENYEIEYRFNICPNKYVPKICAFCRKPITTPHLDPLGTCCWIWNKKLRITAAFGLVYFPTTNITSCEPKKKIIKSADEANDVQAYRGYNGKRIEKKPMPLRSKARPNIMCSLPLKYQTARSLPVQSWFRNCQAYCRVRA